MIWKRKILILILVFFTGEVIFSQNVLPSVQQGHFSDIKLIAISPSEKSLVSYGDDHQLACWDLRTGMQLKRIALDMVVTDLRFFNDKEVMICGAEKVFLYDITKSELNETKIPVSDSVSPRLNKTCENKIYRVSGPLMEIFENDTRIAKNTTQYFDKGYTSIDVNENSQYFFAGSLDGLIYVYDRKTMKLVKTLNEHNSAVHTLAINKSGNILYSSGHDRSIIEWDLKTLEVKRRFYPHSFRIGALAFDKSGSHLYFGDELGQVKSFNMRSYSQELDLIRISRHPVRSIIHSFDGDSTFLITSLDNKIRKFNPSNQTVKPVKSYHHIGLRLLYQNIFQHGLGFYFDPSINDYFFEYSEGGNLVVYHASEKKGSFRRKLIVENNATGKKKKVRFSMNEIREVEVVNDTTFVVIPSNDLIKQEKPFSMVLWKIRNKKLYKYFVSDSLIPTQAESYKGRWLYLVYEKQIRVIDLVTNEISNHDLPVSVNGLWIINDFCFTSDEHNIISVFNLQNNSFKETAKLTGHEGEISSIAMHPGGNIVATSSDDATIKFWSIEKKELLATLIPVDNKDFILLSPGGEYQITKKAFRTFGFNKGLDFFYPDQFDLRFNQPHKVLASIDAASKDQLILLENAYKKRLKRMGFTTESLISKVTLPEMVIRETKLVDGVLSLSLDVMDPENALDRINVYVNDVPVYGSAGYDLKKLNITSWNGILNIPLMSGKNKIEVSVLNSKGIESFRQPQFIINEIKSEPELFIAAIGISEYADKRFNLTYAAKDARDVITAFQSSAKGIFSKVNAFLFTDADADRENILTLREKLKSAEANDVVMIFVAGHGVLDKDFNYYIATHDMDFENPLVKGLPYEELEGFLDGISALRKVLVIDACHSGEVDKDEFEFITANNVSNENVKFRSAGSVVKNKNLGLKSTSELMAELFTDLRKGTGATVISSAGGGEYAMESDQWKNGLFTYCLLHGLTSGSADLDRNGKIMLSEVQSYLRKEVTKLSNGQQQPTSRIENISLDFRIW
jgi:WD40 repeat protein